jgi:transposase
MTGNRNRFSREVCERAVRMVTEHRGEYGSEWEGICSIASKIGCTADTLRCWIRRAERDAPRVLPDWPGLKRVCTGGLR